MRDKAKWLAQTTVWSGQAWGVYRFNLWADALAPGEHVRDLAERHALDHFGQLLPALTHVAQTDEDADERGWLAMLRTPLHQGN